VPIVDIEEKHVPFEDGIRLMKEGLASLGEEYISDLSSGVKDGWIDIYENEGKTSGAYSFGSYDSMPYSLLNYTDKLKDVFTLVHEMGHSMHSFYTRANQPFVYGSHSIFTAEVASTVNESLLINHLINTTDDEAQIKYLINMHIEDFRTTLFRQTMFAEFEKLTHEAVEAGEVLTAEWLSETYGSLNAKYFGTEVNTDDNIKMEWSRIPHFYRAFYVYKYATGYSAATALSKRILEEGEPAVRDYKEFLKSGDSDDPIELLKIAGVDMSSKKPVEDAMKVFGKLVDRFGEIM
jgi:oligoendopeptidase F